MQSPSSKCSSSCVCWSCCIEGIETFIKYSYNDIDAVEIDRMRYGYDQYASHLADNMSNYLITTRVKLYRALQRIINHLENLSVAMLTPHPGTLALIDDITALRDMCGVATITSLCVRNPADCECDKCALELLPELCKSADNGSIMNASYRISKIVITEYDAALHEYVKYHIDAFADMPNFAWKSLVAELERINRILGVKHQQVQANSIIGDGRFARMKDMSVTELELRLINNPNIKAPLRDYLLRLASFYFNVDAPETKNTATAVFGMIMHVHKEQIISRYRASGDRDHMLYIINSVYDRKAGFTAKIAEQMLYDSSEPNDLFRDRSGKTLIAAADEITAELHDCIQL